MLATGAALLAAAIVFFAASGWLWVSAPRAAAAARVRDDALRAGEQAVLNFNTLSYREVGKDLGLWARSSTGPLHRQVTTSRAAFEQQVRQARTVTKATILDAAMTSLNIRAGTAHIIVALQLTVTPAGGTAVTKQSRLAGELTRTAAGWKLRQLGQVPVQAAAGQKPAG